MGVRQLPQITAALIAAGRPGSQPAAIVEAGTLPEQRTVTATLETIADVAAREEVRPPAITIVGPVASLAGELAWLAPRPLAGLSVAVTRARAQASGLARRLQELGASVIQAPVIRVEQLPGPPLDPSPYDLICLASPNAVTGLFERLDDGVHPAGDARALAGVKIAAIGPGTARALAERGVVADVVPERFVAETLVEALAELPVTHALIARARETRDVLPDALRARGAEVDVLALYETLAEPLEPGALEALRAADYITFTSSSTVRFFVQAAGGEPGLSASTRIVSIGPITSETLREHGLEPDIEAATYDVEGMIAALLADATARASNGR
jgi:uroporphyrinogen III methyltransferase/synthase